MRLQSSRAFDISPDSTTSLTMCGGMNHMPSRSARTTSPGMTSVFPIRTGMLMPVTMTRMPCVGNEFFESPLPPRLRDSLEPVNAAVDDHAILGGGLDVVRQLVADEIPVCAE